MRTIGQRELRNDNAEVLRGVEQGETFLITRRGVPVARLMPLATEPDLRCDRPATKRPTYSDSPRVRTATTTGELLDDLRSEG